MDTWSNGAIPFQRSPRYRRDARVLEATLSRSTWIIAAFGACIGLSLATGSAWATAPNSNVSPAAATWHAQRSPTSLLEGGLVQRDDDAAEDVDPSVPGVTLRSWTETDRFRGAPTQIEAAALAALARMSSGYADIVGQEIDISGGARAEEISDILDILNKKLPAGYRLNADLRPAEQTKYSFSAFLRDDGAVELSGDVPDEKSRERLVLAAAHTVDDENNNPVLDRMRLRSGAPDGFAEAAILSLAQLRSLQSGQVSLNDKRIDLLGVATYVAGNANGTCGRLLGYAPRSYSCGFVGLKVNIVHRHHGGAGWGHREGASGGGSADNAPLRPPQPTTPPIPAGVSSASKTPLRPPRPAAPPQPAGGASVKHAARVPPPPQPSRGRSRVVVIEGGDGAPPLPQPSGGGSADNAPEQPFPIVNPASLRAPAQLSSDDQDPRIVDLLFATGRSADLDSTLPQFTGERGDKLIYGQVRVRIPERHNVGRIELPGGFSAFWLNLTGESPDPKTSFTIRSRQIMSEADWNAVIDEIKPDDALIFVHGFNTTFDDAAFRLAQIVWDLQYDQQRTFKGLPVLYSWPSRGEVMDYAYDRESALGARDGFIALLRNLRDKHHISHVHILAHSMGNFLTLEALASLAGSASPVAISDLIMAAPDVDKDQFIQDVTKIEPICSRLTLYASAADKALAASKALAGGVPRAGDVPAGGPIVLAGLDTIDVTAMGDDMFGMNHSVFAEARELLDDVALLLVEGHRPPRLATERGIPEGSPSPVYWRYAP